MWITSIEKDIIKFGKEKNVDELNKITQQLFKEFRFISYSLRRFLEEYGDKIETDKKAENMFEYLSEQWQQADRLFKVLKAYGN